MNVVVVGIECAPWSKTGKMCKIRDCSMKQSCYFLAHSSQQCGVRKECSETLLLSFWCSYAPQLSFPAGNQRGGCTHCFVALLT